MVYYKNINELYKNEFNFPKFKRLKKYRLKLKNEEENEIEIEHVDLLIYLTLITELININEHVLGNLWFCNPRENIICYGLMFQHRWILNQDGCYKLEFGIEEEDEELEEYIKKYEQYFLNLFRKYDICNEELFIEFAECYKNNKLIEMVDSDIWKTISAKYLKEEELDDYRLINKLNWYLINEFAECLENAKIKEYNQDLFK